jgi:nucleoside-diphosphate-sugar epimerase
VDISRLQKWYSNPKTPLDQGITRTYQYFSEMT